MSLFQQPRQLGADPFLEALGDFVADGVVVVAAAAEDGHVWSWGEFAGVSV